MSIFGFEILLLLLLRLGIMFLLTPFLRIVHVYWMAYWRFGWMACINTLTSTCLSRSNPVQSAFCRGISFCNR
jgi:hypothetical protein